ncbi:MAG: phosphoadenylyl-sulfate reductase [Mycobacteriaceae bacterium]|nr:phosphoadenylyl-sulfate reductase [Mycobacteriaceae bacterium]
MSEDVRDLSKACAGPISEGRLRELAARGAAELDGASATDLLRWTDDKFGGHNSPGGATCNYVVASSMRDGVLVDLAAKVRPGVPVMFLDTGYHFAETIGARDAIESVYDIRVLNMTPEHTVAEQDQLLGKNLFSSDPNECCRLRKVVPLTNALRRYSAWVTGLRRMEASTRANAPLIAFDEQFHLVKVNPLAAWTDQDMQDYIERNNVVVNPLVDEGYPSIGCAPCTAKPAQGADPRSGRWQGRSKVECGLHGS